MTGYKRSEETAKSIQEMKNEERKKAIEQSDIVRRMFGPQVYQKERKPFKLVERHEE